MAKEKLYFSEQINEEMAYTKSYLLDEMKEQGLASIEVSEAKSGCCKHRGFCYEYSDDEFILDINGNIIKN